MVLVFALVVVLEDVGEVLKSADVVIEAIAFVVADIADGLAGGLVLLTSSGTTVVGSSRPSISSLSMLRPIPTGERGTGSLPTEKLTISSYATCPDTASLPEGDRVRLFSASIKLCVRS